MTVTTRTRRREERGISRKTIARGMPGNSGVPVVTTLVCFFYFAREAAGALGTRHSLRPLIRANGSCKTSGDQRRGNANAHLRLFGCLKIKSVVRQLTATRVSFDHRRRG